MAAWSAPSGSGATPRPQLPTTSVVTPWCTLLRACGPDSTVRSECVWRSTNPGHTTAPDTSRTSDPGASTDPIAATSPPAISTSARCGGDPVPSTTTPLASTTLTSHTL